MVARLVVPGHGGAADPPPPLLVLAVLGVVGRAAGCGRGEVAIELGGWGFYLPFPSPLLLPVIFLSLIASQFVLLLVFRQ
jgi:hypothetical protein